MEGLNIVASELAEFEQLVGAFRRIMERVERRIQETMDAKFAQIMKDCVRQVVKEEIQSGESTKKRMLAGRKRTNTNVETVSYERRLELKFLDEVSDDVLTGKEIKGKGGSPIRVALVEAGQIVEVGPESSAKVEIVFLNADENDNKHNWTYEDFNSSLVTESDKTKPNFPKKYYVYLDKGIGVLRNAKLANNSEWTKTCKCRLGVRVVENLSGVKVLEAWTNPFVVSDSRKMLYAKHYPPILSDEIWRLESIGRAGTIHKRLKMNNVSTVRDFLFLWSVDPQRLQAIVNVPEKTWKAIESHAQACIKDDTTIYLYNDSSEGNMSVVFDVVGSLKGIIRDSLYVLEHSLSETEKDKARELLRSAFENREHAVPFRDQSTLMRQYPYRASNAGMNASNQKSFHDIDLDMSENEDLAVATETILSFGRSIGSSVSVSNKTEVHQIPPSGGTAARKSLPCPEEYSPVINCEEIRVVDSLD